MSDTMKIVPPAGALDRDTTRRDLLIGGALLGAAGLSYALKPRRSALLLGSAKLDDLVPKQFDRWRFETTSGLVLPPSDQLSDRIYSELLTRIYDGPGGAQVMMLIAYSRAQDGVIQIHRPEVCYPASGYRLALNERHDVALTSRLKVPTRYIIAESEVRREQLLYWSRLGDRFAGNWYEQRVAVIEENMIGLIPDGVLVRFSSVTAGDARPMLDEFAAALFAAVPQRMRNVLVGATAARRAGI